MGAPSPWETLRFSRRTGIQAAGAVLVGGAAAEILLAGCTRPDTPDTKIEASKLTAGNPKDLLPSTNGSRLNSSQVTLNSTDFIHGEFRHAQVFKPIANSELAHIELPIGINGNPTTPLVIELLDNDGKPLTSASLSRNYLAQQGSAWKSIAFQNPPVLAGGSTYAIAARAEGEKNVANSYTWGKNEKAQTTNEPALHAVDSFGVKTQRWDRRPGQLGFKAYTKMSEAREKALQQEKNQEPLVPFPSPLYKIQYPTSWKISQRNLNVPDNNPLRTFGKAIDAFSGPIVGSFETAITVGREPSHEKVTLSELLDSTISQALQIVPGARIDTAQIQVANSQPAVLMRVDSSAQTGYMVIAKKGNTGWKVALAAHPYVFPEEARRFIEKIVPTFEIL